MQAVTIALNQCPVGTFWIEAVNRTVQTLSGIFLLITFLVTYRHNVNVRAGDLLLKLEDGFTRLGSTLAFLEYKKCCYEPIKHTLQGFIDDPDTLNENERRTLEDLDECIRFLFVCTLHSGETICPVGKSGWRRWLYPSRLPQAYYYYLNKLNDGTDRPELYRYIRKFFPTLSSWLDRNRAALSSYGQTS